MKKNDVLKGCGLKSIEAYILLWHAVILEQIVCRLIFVECWGEQQNCGSPHFGVSKHRVWTRTPHLLGYSSGGAFIYESSFFVGDKSGR